MSDPRDFDFFVEDDRIRVRFVAPKLMVRTREGHAPYGDYAEQLIRIHRGELRRSQRNILMHELGHYLVQRQELNPKDTTHEEIADTLTWLPMILEDDRNEALRVFMGLRRAT